MTEQISNADGRLAVFRTINNFFAEALGADNPDRTSKEAAQDARVAEVISTDLLDLLDLRVVTVDNDGSMTVRIRTTP